MALPGTAALLLLQSAVGFGCLLRVGAVEGRPRILTAGLSMILGMGISSTGVFLAEMAGIPLNAYSIFGVNLLLAIAATYPFAGTFRAYRGHFSHPFRDVSPCGVVTLAMVLFLTAPAAWLAYYVPVSAYDAIAGPDLVAKYAVEQGTIASTLFHDLEGNLSNQPFYAPFVMLMQIQYRIAGNPFGQVWLPVMALAFIGVVYSRMRMETHGVIAGFLTVLLVMIPEMYFYTTSVLTDYSNAVFFGCSVLLLHDYLKTRQCRHLALASVLMGLACFTRVDTIVHAGLGIALTVLYMLFKRTAPFPPAKVLKCMGGMFLVSFAFFFVWNVLYINAWLPAAPSVGEQLHFELFDVAKILANVREINQKLVFSTLFYGYIIPIFAAWLVVNAVVTRTLRPVVILLWIAALYTGFVVILGLFPSAVVEFTVKRGFFKLFPLMVFYMAASRQHSPRDQQVDRNPADVDK